MHRQPEKGWHGLTGQAVVVVAVGAYVRRANCMLCPPSAAPNCQQIRDSTLCALRNRKAYLGTGREKAGEHILIGFCCLPTTTATAGCDNAHCRQLKRAAEMELKLGESARQPAPVRPASASPALSSTKWTIWCADSAQRARMRPGKWRALAANQKRG